MVTSSQYYLLLVIKNIGCKVILLSEDSSNISYKNISRDDADTLLTKEFNGAYLFRPSRKFRCSLSVKYGAKVYHIGIEESKEGRLQCTDLEFDSLEELAKYFKVNPLNIVNNKNEYTTAYLRDITFAENI